jgi:hypothetical protein
MPFSIQESAVVSPDLLVQCDAQVGTFKGRCLMEVRREMLGARHPDFMAKDDRLQRDALREMVNQFLGLINRSLESTGFATSIGLPTAFGREEIAQMARSSLHLPYSIIGDPDGVMSFRLGFVHSERGGRLDFEAVNFDVGDGEVDFL